MNSQMVLKPFMAVPSRSLPKPLCHAPNRRDPAAIPTQGSPALPCQNLCLGQMVASEVPALPRQQGHKFQVSIGYTEIRPCLRHSPSDQPKLIQVSGGGGRTLCLGVCIRLRQGNRPTTKPHSGEKEPEFQS